MAYLRIPPSFLPNAIAKLVSKLEVELNTRVQAEAGKIVDKIRSEGCPADLGRAVQKVKGLSDGIGKLQSRMTKLKKLPETLLIPIKILEKIAQVILSLPVPQSPSPIPNKFFVPPRVLVSSQGGLYDFVTPCLVINGVSPGDGVSTGGFNGSHNSQRDFLSIV